MYFLQKSEMNVISKNERNNFATNLPKIVMFWAKSAVLLIRCSPALFLGQPLCWHNLPTQNKHTIWRYTENISCFPVTTFCYDTDCHSSSFRFNNAPHLITYCQPRTMFKHQRQSIKYFATLFCLQRKDRNRRLRAAQHGRS